MLPGELDEGLGAGMLPAMLEKMKRDRLLKQRALTKAKSVKLKDVVRGKQNQDVRNAENNIQTRLVPVLPPIITDPEAVMTSVATRAASTALTTAAAPTSGGGGGGGGGGVPVQTSDDVSVPNIIAPAPSSGSGALIGMALVGIALFTLFGGGSRRSSRRRR